MGGDRGRFRGYGGEFATHLARDGFQLVLIARKPDALDDTARQCRAIGAQVRTLAMDLVDAESVSRIKTETADLEVGLLIYNAGANTCSAPIIDAELSDFDRVIDLKVHSNAGIVQQFARPMRSAPQRRHPLIGSMAATHGSIRQRCTIGRQGLRPTACRDSWLELRDLGSTCWNWCWL